MHYTKMHGAGNSFIVIEDLRGELGSEDLGVLASRLCAAEGVDGMIVLKASAEADFDMLFFNSDGSAGEMCGNGARCVSRYAVEHGIAKDAGNIRFRAAAGEITGRRIDEELYEIRLNDPSVVWLGCRAQTEHGAEECDYVELGEPGIPHAVVKVTQAELDALDALRERGRRLRRSPSFPRGANVSFYCPTGKDSVRARTFERGVEDFTLACGTGSGALAVCLALSGAIPDGELDVDMPGGRLHVSLRVAGGRARDMLLAGPTAVVGEGEFEI